LDPKSVLVRCVGVNKFDITRRALPLVFPTNHENFCGNTDFGYREAVFSSTRGALSYSNGLLLSHCANPFSVPRKWWEGESIQLFLGGLFDGTFRSGAFEDIMLIYCRLRWITDLDVWAKSEPIVHIPEQVFFFFPPLKRSRITLLLNYNPPRGKSGTRKSAN